MDEGLQGRPPIQSRRDPSKPSLVQLPGRGLRDHSEHFLTQLVSGIREPLDSFSTNFYFDIDVDLGPLRS